MNEHSRSIDIRHHAIRQDYLAHKLQIGGVKLALDTSDILTKYLQGGPKSEQTNGKEARKLQQNAVIITNKERQQQYL
jgi:hypothetical protein